MRLNTTTDVEILLKKPLEQGDLSYEDFNELLSARSRDISVSHQARHLFDITVPPTVLNPVCSAMAKCLTEMVLKDEIRVEGSRFVDLGCGCGIIGLAAAEKSAKSVLYTDINPNIGVLKSHPKFRPEIDRVVTQSFCEHEQENSADIVVISIPGWVADQKPSDASIEAGYSRDREFIPAMIREVSNVLVPGGRFVFYYGVNPRQVHLFAQLVALLSERFDHSSLECLLEHQQESGQTYVIFSIQKKL